MKRPNWQVWLGDKKECKLWLDIYIKRKILKKTYDKSKLYLKKTNHNLTFANWIIEKHKDEILSVFDGDTFYDWAINIYYYAIYHAALALISKDSFTSKNHSATLCFLIYYHYHMQEDIDEYNINIIASSLNKKDIETIGLSKELREKACYNINTLFEERLAEHIREQAVEFVNKIKSLIE